MIFCPFPPWPKTLLDVLHAKGYRPRQYGRRHFMFLPGPPRRWWADVTFYWWKGQPVLQYRNENGVVRRNRFDSLDEMLDWLGPPSP